MKLENALQAALRKANLAKPLDVSPSIREKAASIEALVGEYRYRGLPSSCAPDDQLWAITGHHKPGTGSGFMVGGYGVLEWCFNAEDARRRLKIMSLFSCFEDLKAESWSSIMAQGKPGEGLNILDR